MAKLSRTKAIKPKAKAAKPVAAKAKPAPRKSAAKPAAVKTSAKPAVRARAKQAPKRVAKPAFHAIGYGELVSLFDHVRYAVTRFAEAKLVFAHGTTDPVAEAAFIVGEVLHLHPDQFEAFANARVTAAESAKIIGLIHERVLTRKPAAYLVNKVYMHGIPFYVDERTIVPRSFIGELFQSHFTGAEMSLVSDPFEVTSVLDLCTGSGCLAILASQMFPNARIDAVDLSPDALEVAARNVRDHGLEDRITLYQGNLYAPLGDTRYDLIISNPPYVDAEGMAGLPRECEFEPAMAFDGGEDGIDLVRTIIEEAPMHLNEGGGLLCEVGRCKPALDEAYPDLPLLWLDTEDSEGEVFWLSQG